MANNFRPPGANPLKTVVASPVPVPLDAPVTVTFIGEHARELRRIARRVGGVGSDAAVAKLAEIAVVRGLVLVEKDVDYTLYARERETERAMAEHRREQKAKAGRAVDEARLAASASITNTDTTDEEPMT